MSSGQKRAAEDEFDEFKTLVNCVRASWGVYSKAATHAKNGFNSYGFTGNILEKYVKFCTERDKAEEEFRKALELLLKVNKL